MAPPGRIQPQPRARPTPAEPGANKPLWPNWQRRRLQEAEVQGSNPWGGTGDAYAADRLAELLARQRQVDELLARADWIAARLAITQHGDNA